jgi:hypothetical protein
VVSALNFGLFRRSPKGPSSNTSMSTASSTTALRLATDSSLNLHRSVGTRYSGYVSRDHQPPRCCIRLPHTLFRFFHELETTTTCYDVHISSVELYNEDSGFSLCIVLANIWIDLTLEFAAIKFNDHSSRSHSVFTMTIRIKETLAIGNDLLKAV